MVVKRPYFLAGINVRREKKSKSGKGDGKRKVVPKKYSSKCLKDNASFVNYFHSPDSPSSVIEQMPLLQPPFDDIQMPSQSEIVPGNGSEACSEFAALPPSTAAGLPSSNLQLPQSVSNSSSQLCVTPLSAQKSSSFRCIGRQESSLDSMQSSTGA